MLPTAVLLRIALAVSVQGPLGQTRLATGELSAPLEGDLREAVSRYALDRREALALPVTSTLSAPEAFGTRFGASLHLRQLVGGVEVHGARVVVTVDAHRRVVQLASSVVPYARAVLGWRISPDQAVELASSAVDWAMRAPSGRPYGAVRRMLFPRGDEVRAGYLVHVPTLDLTANWYLAVDASTGEVLWRQDRVFHATDEAEVYPTSPGTAGVGTAAVQRVTLNHFAAPRADGGVLEGDQLTMYNCCPNASCDPTGAPRRASGVTIIEGMPVPYDLAICDRLQRASNAASFNPSESYVFTPVDPPTSGTVSQSQPADSDPFVEVHAFFHVNNVYDFVRALSSAAGPIFPSESVPAFQMRDERQGRKPAVWTNVTLPNQQEAYASLVSTGVARSDSLLRVDNAAFMAKEDFDQLMLPGLALDVDTLMIFQGDAADFGYDAPVLWHEFGHGVIASTAAFDAFAIDDRSGNDEGGALHEAIADYLAGAFGNDSVIGEYVGPRMASQTGRSGPIRDMNNGFSCPDVLWGEVHQDSMHFSAALWDARQELGVTSADKDRFDATVYAALVSMTPATDFAQAAAAVTNHVRLGFGAAQESRMKALFDARGVTSCSKVVDVTQAPAPRPYYGIGGWQRAGFGTPQTIPGPYQLKLRLPNGAKSLTVSAPFDSGFFGSSTPTAHLLVRSGAPITFTRGATSLTNDADAETGFALSSGAQRAVAPVQVPCGGELFFAVGSTSGEGEHLEHVAFSVAEADSCPVSPADGGAGPVRVRGGGARATAQVASSCGCGSSDAGLAVWALLAAGGALRRREARGAASDTCAASSPGCSRCPGRTRALRAG